MKNTVGPPVSGEDFRYREKNLRKALRYMKNGNSFLILGIRRTGKSSFLQQSAYLLRQENPDYICIELDCQTYGSMLDFYKGLYNEMPKSLRTKFKKLLKDSRQLPKTLIDFITDIFESVEILGSKIDFQDKMMNYSKPFEDLVASFFKETENVFLFLDELPFFFENMGQEPENIKKITHILTNLRSWRHNGLSMGITGSLNLHQQLEHLGISRKLLAGLNTIELDPFTLEESEAFISELLSIDKCEWWTKEITNKLLALLPDYIPYFLQYTYNEIVVNECKTPKEVEEVYHNEITSGLFKNFVYQFDNRLKIFKEEELESAMAILDALALAEEMSLNGLQEKAEGLFDYEVLVKLIDYEFIKISGLQEYSFTLQIIKDWWITKRGLKKDLNK